MPICYAIDLIQKVVDESFFVETSKGRFRVISGDWFYHKGKYFYVDNVIKGILKLIEINNSYKIDLEELHDILYAGYIDDKEVLEAIQNMSNKVF
jgi:hypothetical protein